MRRNQFIHEFDLVAEILPITLAGILLNVVGRQIAEAYGLPFVDMIGTAFTAILLGPWWAATAAAATTIVNGIYFDNYFPFGVVNIIGGLVWGYLARGTNVAAQISEWNDGWMERFIELSARMTVVGGITCGLGSSCVKLILYPELERPFVFGPFYSRTHEALQQIFIIDIPDVITLIAGDLFRDITDKFIVVPIALLLVSTTRIAAAFGNDLAPHNVWHRLQTDMLSIFVFAVTYSVFIFLAQATRAEIFISGAAHPVAWLGIPSMVVLLYVPLILALLAFRFLTFNSSHPQSRQLHTLRRDRRAAAKFLFAAGGPSASFVRAAVTQGMGIGAGLWPIRDTIDTLSGIPVALTVIVLALAGYMFLARVFYTLLRQVTLHLTTVTRWLEVGATSAATLDVVKLMQDLFRSYIQTPDTSVQRKNGLTYSLGFVCNEQRGRLEEALFGRIDDTLGARIAILGSVDAPHAIDNVVVTNLEALVKNTGAGLVALSTTTSRVIDRTQLSALQQLRRNGTEVLLLDWTDLHSAVISNALTNRPHTALRHARARALQLLNSDDERHIVEELDRIAWLRERALSSLKHVIDNLPKSSMVMDLGCGYGRHAIAAAMAGHATLAVDRKESICTRLKADLSALPPTAGKIDVLNADLRDVSPDRHGLADLVICTGVLQHARSSEDLAARLDLIATLAAQPAAQVYVEMLFDMLFDGNPPSDGRMSIGISEFEKLMDKSFPLESWTVLRTSGPLRQSQSFAQGGRSFEAPNQLIESTAVEYLIKRRD